MPIITITPNVTSLSETGVSPALNGAVTFTETADQVSITQAGQVMIFALPQSIAPTSSPTFAGLTLNGNLSGTGSIRSTGPTSGVGYFTGAGGSVTQATDKSTAVTLDTVCGRIIMNNAALAAATIVSFTFNNSAIGTNDRLVLNHVATGTGGAYTINAMDQASGSRTINVRNNTAGSLSEAIIIGFAVIKAVIV